VRLNYSQNLKRGLRDSVGRGGVSGPRLNFKVPADKNTGRY